MSATAGVGKRSVYAGAVLLVLGGVLVPPAMAQSWSIKSGRNVGTLLPGENRKLPDGSMYATGGSKVLVETEDPSYPITGQTMDCRWVCKVSVNAQDASCVTLCSGVDQNGDLFSFTSLGSNTGNYQVGPGTGKYVGATGGGTFEVVPTADPILSYVRWKGTLQLK